MCSSNWKKSINTCFSHLGWHNTNRSRFICVRGLCHVQLMSLWHTISHPVLHMVLQKNFINLNIAYALERLRKNPSLLALATLDDITYRVGFISVTSLYVLKSCSYCHKGTKFHILFCTWFCKTNFNNVNIAMCSISTCLDTLDDKKYRIGFICVILMSLGTKFHILFCTWFCGKTLSM